MTPNSFNTAVVGKLASPKLRHLFCTAFSQRDEGSRLGELDREIPHRSRADEIGKIAAALEVFRENALANQRLEERLPSSRPFRAGARPLAQL
ncbi:HAMP domain-containing protein [Rhizobium sullae]|uniref:HAMP domain-containing protein n=1 Tax=Rhizobium sullae TaxID=50338 RepID=A0A4R3PVN1_RHISU|nr:HAMP domain-containing protein [Rhizobium sullae]TCU04512.1 hypothetical protein EV132_13923 [Rhizobium sullae]